MSSRRTDENVVWEIKQLPMELLTRAIWEVVGGGANGARIDYGRLTSDPAASPLSPFEEERAELLCGIAQELFDLRESKDSVIQIEVYRELLVHLFGGGASGSHSFSENSDRRFAAGSVVQ